MKTTVIYAHVLNCGGKAVKRYKLLTDLYLCSLCRFRWGVMPELQVPGVL